MKLVVDLWISTHRVIVDRYPMSVRMCSTPLMKKLIIEELAMHYSYVDILMLILTQSFDEGIHIDLCHDVVDQIWNLSNSTAC